MLISVCRHLYGEVVIRGTVIQNTVTILLFIIIYYVLIQTSIGNLKLLISHTLLNTHFQRYNVKHVTIYRSDLSVQTDLRRFIDYMYDKSLQFFLFAQSVGSSCIFYLINRCRYKLYTKLHMFFCASFCRELINRPSDV